MKITLSDNPFNNIMGLYHVAAVKIRNKSYSGLEQVNTTLRQQQAICHAKGIIGFIFPYQEATVGIITGKKRHKVIRKSWPLVPEPEEEITIA